MASNADLQYKFTIEGVERITNNLNEMNLALKDTTAWLNKAKIGSQDFVNAMATKNQIMVAKTNILATNAALQQTSSVSANAGMALLNLNYVIRDSPYFFNNFALGVLAVGNNINPLIDSFTRLRQEAGQKSISTLALLRQALVGGAGISIAFSVVVTAIQAFVFWQAKSSREAEKTTEKIKTQKSELDKLSRSYLESSIKMAEAELLRQQVISPPETKTGFDTRRLFGGQSPFYEFEIKGENEAIKLIEEKIASMKRELLYRGLNEEAQIRLNANKKKENDLNKDNWNLIVPIAKSYDDAVRILNEWIKADEKILGTNQRKTKELKEQKEMLGATPPLIRAIVDAMQMYNTQMALLGLGGGVPGTGGGGLRPSGGVQPRTNPFLRTLDDIKKALDEEFKPILQSITQVANTAGNAISNAFLSGKNVIDAATQALMQFIVQLLVVQSIMGILTSIFIPGGTFLGGFTSFLGGGGMPKAYSPSMGMLNKGATIRVEGNLRAESNEFIAGFNKAVNVYNKNVKGNRIGG